MGCGFGKLDYDAVTAGAQRGRSPSIVSISARRGYESALRLIGRSGSPRKRAIKIEPSGNKSEWTGIWNIPVALFGSASDECCRALAMNLVPHLLYKDEVR